uniref:Doublecortin domain-containing protein n=1 Tax=Plectus sambesii TaxID=2011161 RepID=A0A914W3Z0_9BILA
MSQVPTIQKQHARRLLLLRNGETMFPPTYWSYNNRTLKTWDKVCEDISMKILPTRKNMWGRGGEDNDVAVICGPEPWKDIKGGYRSLIPEQKTPRDASKSEYQEPKQKPSYRDINKKKYGNIERSEDEKLHNRTKVAPVRRIFVRKNGDARFQPKTYIWRLGQTSKLEHLKTELTKIAPPAHGNVKIIYDMKGKEITDESQIKDGQTYVAAGDTEFDLGEDEQLTDSDDDKSVRPDRRRARSQNNVGANKQQGNGKNGQMRDTEESLDERQKKWKNLTGEELTDKEREEIDRRDRQFLNQHFTQQRQVRRSKSAHIFNRKDQTNPDAYLIYAFRNGAGSDAQCVNFNRKQLEKGMPIVLEIIAKRFSINPKKLCAMDGREIKSVRELITRGSYVIIPLGEQFRDTWYFLPSQAIDTSEDPESDNDRIVGNDSDSDNGNPRRRDSRTESDRDDDRRRNAARSRSGNRPATSRNRNNSKQRPQTQDGRRSQVKSRNANAAYNSRRGSSAGELRRAKSRSTRY